MHTSQLKDYLVKFSDTYQSEAYCWDIQNQFNLYNCSDCKFTINVRVKGHVKLKQDEPFDIKL